MQIRIRLFGLALLMLMGATTIRAQEFPNADIGIQLGGGFYLGDINKVPFKGTRPAVGAFYRHNINVRYSVRPCCLLGR